MMVIGIYESLHSKCIKKLIVNNYLKLEISGDLKFSNKNAFKKISLTDILTCKLLS